MRGILWASAAAALVGTAVTARADERGAAGFFERGRDVVQAGFHKHGGSKGSCCTSSCDPCGEDDVRIGRYIDMLLHGEKSCNRKWAACKLDCYNWTQHPEIVAALTYAMQSDCDPCVRKAAACSLKDMKVSEPDAVGAMQFTRQADPNCWVRLKAKCAAKKAECSRPPMLTYVSGYGPSLANGSTNRQNVTLKAGPTLEPAVPPKAVLEGAAPKVRVEQAPTPAPKRVLEQEEPVPTQENKERGPAAKRSVRTMVSNAVSKVRSRL